MGGVIGESFLVEEIKPLLTVPGNTITILVMGSANEVSQ
jgi:hypothetical protein